MAPKRKRLRPGMAQPHTISIGELDSRTGALPSSADEPGPSSISLPSSLDPPRQFDTTNDYDDQQLHGGGEESGDSMTYRDKVNAAFDHWANRVPSLVSPYLIGRRKQLLTPSDILASCACECPAALRRPLRLVDLRASTQVAAHSCTDHFVPGLVAAGWFPANASGAHTAFSFALLQLLRCLQRHSRLGINGFVSALLDFHDPDQGFASTDDMPKQLSRASAWFDVLSQEVRHHALCHDPPPTPPSSASASAVPAPALQRPSEPLPNAVPASAAVDASAAAGAGLHLAPAFPFEHSAAAKDMSPAVSPTTTPASHSEHPSSADPAPLSQPSVPIASASATAQHAGHLQFPMPAEDPDLRISVHDLANRCPACFGAIAGQEPRESRALPIASVVASAPLSRSSSSIALPSADLIVCLDGNFTHKRRKRLDAVTRSPSRSTFFLSHRQVDSAAQTFLTSAKTDGPRTGCTSEVKAAVEGAVKASKGSFDIVGLVGMTCRHGAPLLFCDVRETGEAHFYAFALLDHLLRVCAGRIKTLGVCYDIGCKLAVSPRIKSSLAPHGVQLVFVVSLFHVFGHDVDCRLKFSPRRTIGFGLTDGESLERLWSAMSGMISVTRGMSRVGRHLALTAHLHFLVHEHIGRLSSVLRARQARLNVERSRAVPKVERAVAMVCKWASSDVDDGPANGARSPNQPRPYPTRFPPALIAFSSDFALLCQRRRQKAFQRVGYRRRVDGGSPDLYLAAKSLWVCLSQWHALEDFVKRRNGVASQKTQARLISAKIAAQSKAKRLRPQVNDAIIESSDMAAILNVGPLYIIEERQLWTADTLARVTRYAGSHVDREEPWFSDGALEDGLDAFELLERCDEEEARLDAELLNLDTWLQRVRRTVQANRTLMQSSGWIDLLDAEASRLDVLANFWQRPLPKRRSEEGICTPPRESEPDGLLGVDADTHDGVNDTATAPGPMQDQDSMDANDGNVSEFSVAEDEFVERLRLVSTDDDPVGDDENGDGGDEDSDLHTTNTEEDTDEDVDEDEGDEDLDDDLDEDEVEGVGEGEGDEDEDAML
ncbi:hypothetical protein OC844_002756 [Tilletia horrida]|nr:hypothetical protein OC844_002756 [Tilletia horrida]